MKSFIICVLFYSTAVFGMFSSSIDDNLHEQEGSCASISGASYSSIESARQKHQIPDNEQMNAFAKCMLQKFNVINPKGFINSDTSSYTILSDMPDNIDRISNICKTLTGKDDGDTARKIMNCYLDNNQIVMALTPRL